MVSKVALPADFGIENLYCRSHGNIMIKQQDSTERTANSMIMSLNSPVFAHMFLTLELTTVEMEDFSVEAVNVFLEGLYSGDVKLKRDLFRDIVKMAHVFKVFWMTSCCDNFFSDLVLDVGDEIEDFNDMRYIFEEARYIKDAIKKPEYLDIAVNKISSVPSIASVFVERYMSDYLNLSTDQLDLMIRVASDDVQIFLKIMKENIVSQGLVFDKISKYLLQNINLVGCREQNSELYEEFFDVLQDQIQNLSVEDMRLIMKLNRDAANQCLTKQQNTTPKTTTSKKRKKGKSPQRKSSRNKSSKSRPGDEEASSSSSLPTSNPKAVTPEEVMEISTAISDLPKYKWNLEIAPIINQENFNNNFNNNWDTFYKDRLLLKLFIQNLKDSTLRMLQKYLKGPSKRTDKYERHAMLNEIANLYGVHREYFSSDGNDSSTDEDEDDE